MVQKKCVWGGGVFGGRERDLTNKINPLKTGAIMLS